MHNFRIKNVVSIVSIFGFLLVFVFCAVSLLFYLIDWAELEIPHHNHQWMITPAELLRTQYGVSDDPDDTGLISNIRYRWLVKPSELPRTLASAKIDRSQEGQSRFVDRFFRSKSGGVFVECGALDGETFSNTLFLEIKRQWTGLLIEANHNAFKQLLTKNRNAYSINACVSTTNSSGPMNFAPAWLLGGLVGTMDTTHMKAIGPPKRRAPEQMVQCFPMYSMIIAAGFKHVDYLSLDIEGAELEVLRTMPLNSIRIELISIEYRSSDMRNINVKSSLNKLHKLKKFFKETKLYEEVGILPNRKDEFKTEELGLDVFFKRI